MGTGLGLGLSSESALGRKGGPASGGILMARRVPGLTHGEKYYDKKSAHTAFNERHGEGCKLAAWR